MRYDLRVQYQAEQARKRLESLIAKGATIDLTEKHVRTLQQNAYLHVCLAWIALRLGHSIEYVKEQYYKLYCSPDIFVCEKYDKVLRKGVRYLRSSRDLTKEEMTVSIERFRNFAAQEAGEYIPSPEEHAFLNYIETEIERNKVYIVENETHRESDTTSMRDVL